MNNGEDGSPARDERAAEILRRRAEACAAAPDLAPDQLGHMLHELSVHQIELEMQNEELRRTQAELEAARARYFALYDLAPVSYFTLNEVGQIEEANLTAARVLGQPRGALVHQPLARFVAPADQDRYYLYLHGLASGGGPHACELRMLRLGGDTFWARLETTIVAELGSAALYRVVASDISARVHAEAAVYELNAKLERRVAERTAALEASQERLRQTNAELERAMRLKDEFLAMMGHELRTPLSVVLSIADAMMGEVYDPITAAQRQALTTIGKSGRHLLAILSDILDLARITTGHEHLDLYAINVDMLCGMAIELVEPAARAKQIRLRTTIGAGISGLYADERRLTQILVNLLDNAIKFTPSGGAVSLEVIAAPLERCVLFSVEDTGKGIAPIDQERIFRHFTQLDAGLSRRYGGIGLGLALVRRLTELHGGSVSLTSTPNQGSRFTIRIPWPTPEPRAPEVAATLA